MGNVIKRLLKLFQKSVPGFWLRIQMLRWCSYHIGKQTYIGEDLIIIDEPSSRGMVAIGNRVSISPRVTFITSSYPNNSLIQPFAPNEYGPIIIEDDAWIGTGAIIFPNITIGRGAIVGAASLVNKNVPPYTIVVGIPARPIRTITGLRDSDNGKGLST